RLADQGMDIKQMFTAEVVENLRERSRPDAETRLQRTMALGEIAKQESLSVEKSDVDAKVEEVMKDLKDTSDVDHDRLREILEEDLLKEKIFSWLEENNTVELVPEGTLQKEDAAEEAEGEAEATTTVEAPPASTEAPPEEIPAAEVEVEVEAATIETSEAAPVEATPEEPKKTTKKSSRSKTTKPKADKAESDDEAPSEAAEAESKPAAKAKGETRKKTTRSKASKAEESEASEES
ncbi:MAG: hypothetical protein AAFY26_17255, partial [Cyanobacteria bacterium J06638_22]